MYQFSDSDTTDSDDGIRFKTATTRHKHKEGGHSHSHRHGKRSRSRTRHRTKSRSPKRHHSSHKTERRSHRRSRSRSYDRTRNRSRSRSRDKCSRRSNETSRRKSRSRSLERNRTKRNLLDDDRKQVNINIKAKMLITNHLKEAAIALTQTNTSPDGTEDKICGPVLPSRLQIANGKDIDSNNIEVIDITNENTEEKDDELSNVSSVSPKNSISGPTLSDTDGSKDIATVCEPVLPSDTEPVPDSPVSDDQAVCGPALPPHLLLKKLEEEEETIEEVKQEKHIGPYIPEHLRKQLAESEIETKTGNDAQNIDAEVEIDDECYGPLPANILPRSQGHIALEERALQMKLDQLAPQSIDAGREEWMLELPTVHSANLGLGPRQFRAKVGPDLSDRSSWTDTPNSKKKKGTEKAVDLKETAELNELKKRDEEQEEMVKKSKKKNKRDKSLLEQHQDKLNSKKHADKEEGKHVRRPFNRDTDLKVNQFDDAQKKSIMKKAQLLDDRFSQGQAKFL